MYLSWLAIIVIVIIAYLIGKSVGKRDSGAEDSLRERLDEHGIDHDDIDS